MWNQTNLLDTFFDSYFFNTDFRTRANAEGITLEKLRIKEYPRALAYWKHSTQDAMPHEAAVQRTIAVHGADFAIIDDLEASPMALIQEFKKAVTDIKYKSLGEELRNNPSKAKGILEAFSDDLVFDQKIRRVDELILESAAEYDARTQAGNEEVLVFNWRKLSQMVGGFNPARLSIFMADSGFGKTNFAVNFGLNVAHETPVLYLNQEMDPYDIAKRMAVIALRRPYIDFRRNNLFKDAAHRIGHKNLFLSDGRPLSIPQIRALINLYCREQNIKFCIIDYDQKIELNSRLDEWKALQNAFTEIESIAKEKHIHIMILAQTNSEGGISGSRRSGFVASTVLRFFKDDQSGKTLIQAVKNRFGRANAALEIRYETETFTIEEVDYYAYSKPKR